ncbi:MAG: glycosyltransferase family 39 protein [Victivallales bacterium]|jgi:4-amino-4-deoxy-L-arabinose transferase-like glycosyltransferase|nr:glycosyltransferase family 39 protein [Victivallales bacterium]
MKDLILRFWRQVGDNPAKTLFFFVIASVGLWTIQCSLLQNIQSLDTLEALTWGAQGEWGHFKHPPLSGWIGYWFSVLTGHGDWGLYLLSQLCLAIGVWFAYLLGKEFWSDKYSAATGALLLYVLHYYNPSWMKYSTYFVEIALRPIMAYFFFMALKHNRLYQWGLFGLFCGLGILAKYSTVPLLFAFLLIFFWRKEYRVKALSIGPYLAFAIFLLVIAPHVNWLVEHDFPSFKHVENRMAEEHTWYMPLIVTATALYPLLAEMGVLLLACFPHWRDRERKTLNRDALFWALTLTLIPSAVYILLSLLGSDIILMWFCSLACWSGIAVVAAFPFKLNGEIFRKLFLLLVIYTACLFIGTSCDLMFSSRSRLHTRPEAVVNPALDFWQKHSNKPIPVVVGDRWLTGVVENYTKARPPACEVDDIVYFDLYKERIAKDGALLLAGEPKELDGFLAQIGNPEIEFTFYRVPYHALRGRTKKLRFVLGYLPPNTAKIE